MPSPDREYWSADRTFGLKIGEIQLQKLLGLCNDAGENETGGILVGFYSGNHDCAIITDLCGPTPDSRSGKTWFRRGIRGLQKWLRQLWLDGTFYLGEWHFHPCSDARPSKRDCDQLIEIASSEKYHCPEPILLVIGGTPPSNWELVARVFPRGQASVPLDNWPLGI